MIWQRKLLYSLAAAAITTAGDRAFGVALDQPPKGYILSKPEIAKPFMAKLLEGATVRLVGDAPWLQESALPFSDDADPVIEVTCKDKVSTESHLIFHPQNLALGVGCERGCPVEDIAGLLGKTLVQHNL